MNEQNQNQDEHLNAFERMINVFFSPGKAMASVAAKPSWVLPVILVTLISIVFTMSAKQVIIHETLTKQEQKMLERDMDPDQIDEILSRTEGWMNISMPIGALVFPVIMIVIVSAIYLFVGNVILGGSASFKPVFAVTAHAWLIFSVGSLVALPIVLSKETVQVSFSLATLLSEEARETFLYQFLTKIDIFAIWYLGVQSIGLAAVYNMSTKKMATTLAILYLLYAVIASSLAAIF